MAEASPNCPSKPKRGTRRRLRRGGPLKPCTAKSTACSTISMEGGARGLLTAFDLQPFWSRESTWAAAPAVDVAETEKAYEITAELPGMDEKNIEVKFADGLLTITGEKKEEKEEKKKDYYLSERSYGSFQRSFQVPDSVDADKIEATFKKGVLTVTLPKTAAAQKAAKKIDVKAA